METSKVRRIGVFTSGGDAPGMNAAIRSVVRTALHMGIECVGIRRGYHGLINCDVLPLTFESVSGLSRRGGTMLYSARSEEFKVPEGRQKAVATCKLLGLDGLVGIGGDGTFRGLLELSGKRVCILGCGDVGREIAKRLKAFGCRITGVNRTVRVLPDFDEVLPLDKLAETAAACDILVCCIALTPETRSIVSEEIFGRLHDGVIFVNVARGALADEATLTKWLQSGGRAVLDVFEEEPLPESSPLWNMENAIVTPHNCFASDGNRARLWAVISTRLIGDKT